MTLNLPSLLVAALSLTMSVVSVQAQSARTIDARTLLTPRSISKSVDQALATQGVVPVTLNLAALADVVAQPPATLALHHVPMPNMSDATFDLRRTSPVVDGTTIIEHGTPNGRKPLRVRPVVSYLGTINGDPSSRVTLHISNTAMVGVVEQSGRRVLIDRDFSVQATKGDVAMVIGDERGVLDEQPLRQFLCGTQDQPLSEEVLRLSNSYASFKPMDRSQMNLLELRLAVEINDDITTEFIARGQTEEEVAQYFIMIIACMNQIYEEEVGTRFTLSLLRIYNEFEPAGYQFNGTEPGRLLGEFARRWSQTETNTQRDIAHHFAKIRPVGGGFVGGIAFGGSGNHNLCNRGSNGSYAVSTVYYRRNEIMPGRPDVRRGFVWDYFVIAHEIGHNVGAWHTHNCNWPPAIRDTCQVTDDNTDACASGAANRRPRPGTIMSYCHLVNGESTPPIFGSGVASRMRQWVESSCARPPAEPTVSITSPRGTQTFNGGDELAIRWQSARVQSVTLQYSTNDGGSWTTIVESVPATDREYLWRLPAIDAPSLWIRAFDVQSQAVADTTLASYRISLPLSLNEPRGGERYGVGRQVNVTWTRQQSVGAVKVELSLDNGTTWQTVAPSVTESTFLWTVPDSPTDQARIRVSSVANPSVMASSDAFSIGRPRLSIDIPLANGEICNNHPNQFRWSADYVDRIRIDFSTDGVQWRLATTQPSVDASQWQIFSISNGIRGLAANTTCSIRMRSTTDTTLQAIVEGIRVIECDGPVSVNEGDPVSSGLVIRSITPNPARSQAVLTFGISTTSVVSVDLVSVDGRRIPVLGPITAEPSFAQSLTLALDAVPQGRYQLVLRSGSESVTVPFNVVR
jgi:hypothetical protein